MPGSDSGGAIYTGDTASYPFEPGVPTEANPAQATGGTGQDIFAINIDTLSDGQFFEITDFNEAEDTLVLTNASEHAPPDSLVVSSVEAQPAEDGSYTDVLLHTDSGAGDTLTTIRLMGVSDYNPDNLLFSERVNMPIGPNGAVTDDPFTISPPMRIVPAGSGASASIDVTGSDDAFVGTGAGNDVLELDGAMDAVDPGAGTDTMVLHLQADDPAGATIIRLNDPADSLHFDIADDVTGSVHTELEPVGDTSFGSTHGGQLYLNVYLSDAADPDTSALTPIARLYLGDYEAGSVNGTPFVSLNGNAAPDLTFNRTQISGWQPGDSLVGHV